MATTWTKAALKRAASNLIAQGTGSSGTVKPVKAPADSLGAILGQTQPQLAPVPTIGGATGSLAQILNIVNEKPTPGLTVGTSAQAATNVPKAVVPKASSGSTAVGSAPSGVAQLAALPTSLSNSELAALKQQATNSVHAELAPSVNALVTQYQQSQRQAIADKAKREAEGKAQVNDIGVLFKRLVEQQGQSAKASQAVTDTNRQQSAGNYAALQQGIGQNYGAATQDVGAELARLGLNNVIAPATAGIDRDGQFLAQLTGVDAANADNNINTQGSLLQNLYKLFQSNANTESGVRQTEAKQGTKDATDDIVSKWLDTQTQLRNSRTTLEGTRGAKIQDLITQLSDKKLAQKQQNVQIANQQRAQQATAALEAYKVKLANQPQPVTLEDKLNLALKQAQLDNLIARTKATVANQKNPDGTNPNDIAAQYAEQFKGSFLGFAGNSK